VKKSCLVIHLKMDLKNLIFVSARFLSFWTDGLCLAPFDMQTASMTCFTIGIVIRVFAELICSSERSKLNAIRINESINVKCW